MTDRHPDEALDATGATVLDLRGLNCPLPVLKARKAMQRIAPGDRLLLETTDPMTAVDVPHYCNEAGHRLLGQDRVGDVMRYLLEKGR